MTTKTKDGTGRYQAALADLAAALREGRLLAEVLSFYANQLRGAEADLDGPLPTTLPTPAAVLATLRKIDEARLELERAWSWLSDEAKETLPSPDAIAEAEGESW